MGNAGRILRNMVPISDLNRGKASQVIGRVQQGEAVVVVRNNAPVAVMISPEEYERLQDLEEDFELLSIAASRMSLGDPSEWLTMEQVMEKLGVTREELDAIEVADEDIE